MRVKEPFAAKRKSEINDYEKKYYIAYEGSQTEPRYFDELAKSLIKENISVISLLRDYAKTGKSNPTHVIKLLEDFFENSEEETTVGELKSRLSNWNHENSNKINEKIVFSKLDELYTSNKEKIPYNDLESVFMHLFKNEVFKDLSIHFKEYFEAQDVTYNPRIDSINMIIDRDSESFSESQYDKVVEFCEKNNVDLYVSNPCFELWLYMHFDEYEKENKSDLLKNKKLSKHGKRYIEKKLNNICGYKKNYLPFGKLEQGVFKAIEREKRLTEDIYKIKNELGTNVGILVEKLTKDK